jgi:hypothetical protein
MNLILRIGAALFFGGFLVYVLRLVSNGKMLLKYSLLWILMCMAALICDLCPQIIYSCSTAIGFVNPANFLFLGAIVLLPRVVMFWRSKTLLIGLPCSKKSLRKGLIMNELNTWFDSVPSAIPH